MSTWEKSPLVCGIYTVSPLHVSTGQAEGAIDLPVMKEPHTGFPIVPASSLKGIARDAFQAKIDGKPLEDKTIDQLFGPSLKASEQESEDEKLKGKPSMGAVIFTEARLVAYAARSLNRPFLYVTCRLVLERLDRDLRAAGCDGLGSIPVMSEEVLVTVEPLAKGTLVVEDLVYTSGIAFSVDLKRMAEGLARLLPQKEEDTRKRLNSGLVLLPDEDFAAIVRRLPVRARIKLNSDTKTTSGKDGNLWYEEQVPADCLFVSMIGARRGKGAELEILRKNRDRLAVVQIGGNETVGEGICFWTLGTLAASPEAQS